MGRGLVDGKGCGRGPRLGIREPRPFQCRVLNNLNNGRALTSNNRLPGLRSIANELHGNHHKRESLLSAEAIRLDLDSIAELLEILDPLTEPAG